MNLSRNFLTMCSRRYQQIFLNIVPSLLPACLPDLPAFLPACLLSSMPPFLADCVPSCLPIYLAVSLSQCVCLGLCYQPLHKQDWENSTVRCVSYSLFQLECCGGTGYHDWEKNVAFSCSSSSSLLRCSVPLSCCTQPTGIHCGLQVRLNQVSS